MHTANGSQSDSGSEVNSMYKKDQCLDKSNKQKNNRSDESDSNRDEFEEKLQKMHEEVSFNLSFLYE